jgi:hypothetical protein
MPRRLRAALAAALFLLAPAAQAQEPKEEGPAEALAAAIVAACRQNDAQFAPFLTADNAAVFRELPANQRTALMKRFTLLDDPGRPLLSRDTRGHAVVRCETSSITTEMRFGETRQRENLAFIPVEVRVPGNPGETAENSSTGRRVEFGMVRESSGWKLLSVGLLLLNLADLSQQWAASEVQSNETAAIAALRKFAQSIGTYRRAFGKLPDTLAQLGPASKEGISPEAAGLLDAELAAGKKGGYLYRYRVPPTQGEGAEPGFELAATPAEYGKTGRRSFFLDAGGTLRGGDKQGGVATASDPRIEPR